MKKDLTKGSILKTLFSLSWPMMIAFLLHSGFNLVDAFFVGKISANALAAVSISFPVVFFMIAIGLGIGIGTTSLIARLLGAKRKKEADIVAEHSILISIVIAFLFTFFILIFAEPIFKFAGADKNIMPLVLDYIRIIIWGAIFTFMMFTINSILRGEGDTKTPMYALGFSNILNAILDPIFIFGLGIIPSLGIKGAAIATVISRVLAIILLIHHLLKGNSYITLNFKIFKYKPRIIKDIFHVGIPASLSQITHSVGMFLLLKIISFFGANAIAAYGLAGRIEAVALLPIIAIGTATITLVGHNIGAKKLKRAEKTTWTAVILSIVIIEVIGFLIFLTPYKLIFFFNTNPEVIKIGGDYLKIVSLTYIFAAVGINIGSAFQGAGKGIPAFMSALLRLILIGIPLAWFLAIKLNLGINWIWYSMIFAALITYIVMILWYKTGSWKKGHHLTIKEVPEPVN